jgi:hypothetical protein
MERTVTVALLITTARHIPVVASATVACHVVIG